MKKDVGTTKFKPSLLFFGASVAAVVVSFVLVTALEIMQERKQTPRLAVDSMVKALRKHYKQTGRFPADFQQLNERVWKHKTSQNYGSDNRTMAVGNYYYMYYPANAQTCTIWAIPTGPKREEGSTHFLVLTYDTLRRWKGAPLSLDEVRKLPVVPQYREMGAFGMLEQQPIALEKRKS